MVGIRILDICHEHFAKKLPCKNINTHRCKITLWMLRLFLEFYNTSGFICVHDTKTAGLLHRDLNNCDGCVSIGFLMSCQHFVIVHFVNMISGKNQNIFRIKFIDEIDILGNRICGSTIYIQIFVSLFTGRKNIDTTVFGIQTPTSAGCNIAVQLNGFILCKHTYYINTTIGTVT